MMGGFWCVVGGAWERGFPRQGEECGSRLVGGGSFTTRMTKGGWGIFLGGMRFAGAFEKEFGGGLGGGGEICMFIDIKKWIKD